MSCSGRIKAGVQIAVGIGRPVIQKLHSAFMTERADAGIVISTSGFSAEAKEYEYSKPITSNVMDAISRVTHVQKQIGQFAGTTHVRSHVFIRCSNQQAY